MSRAVTTREAALMLNTCVPTVLALIRQAETHSPEGAARHAVLLAHQREQLERPLRQISQQARDTSSRLAKQETIDAQFRGLHDG